MPLCGCVLARHDSFWGSATDCSTGRPHFTLPNCHLELSRGHERRSALALGEESQRYPVVWAMDETNKNIYISCALYSCTRYIVCTPVKHPFYLPKALYCSISQN